jgi:hypothetical protein
MGKSDLVAFAGDYSADLGGGLAASQQADTENGRQHHLVQHHPDRLWQILLQKSLAGVGER